MTFLSLRAPLAADMLSLCLFYAILFLFPFLAFSVSYPPPPYSSGDGFSSPPPPPPLASSRQGFSSPPPPPPFASRRQGFSSPPPPPPYSSSGEGFSSPPPPPPHASVRVFRSPPPPPPHPSGEGFRPPPPPPPYPSDQDNCQPYGSLFCGGQYVPTYICSPKITSSTPAILVTSDFSGAGGGGGGPSECDGKYHNNSEIIVGLSTGWYNGGLLCGKMIKITALNNGKSVVAKVVDECDSMRGCDEEHSGQPPCGNNIINGSDAVWAALGLDKNFVEVNVSWSRVMDVGCDSNINYIVHIM